LNPEEFEVIKQHAVMGVEIINHIKPLRHIIPGLKYHHEQMDGAGYPEGLSGDRIPFIAKIVAVADTYDAMTTDRPYRKALSKELAIKELEKCSGLKLDRKVVEAFMRAFEKKEI
jgi:HD-GYP domain-containing protein (c-di-GMP phosphodiesterase class II)